MHSYCEGSASKQNTLLSVCQRAMRHMPRSGAKGCEVFNSGWFGLVLLGALGLGGFLPLFFWGFLFVVLGGICLWGFCCFYGFALFCQKYQRKSNKRPHQSASQLLRSLERYQKHQHPALQLTGRTG